MVANFNQWRDLISHGVYVIAVTDGLRQGAFTAAWVMQVSFEPFLLAFSINPRHRSYQILKAGQYCSINVLAEGQLDIAAHFARSDLVDKMADHAWDYSANQVPILKASLGYFEARVQSSLAAGDHEIMVCEVLSAGELHGGVVMSYRDTANLDGSRDKE